MEKKKKRGKPERERRSRVCGCITLAVTDGYVFSTRTESEPELWEDGFYFEVFPPIVHYCRELLLREAEVSKIRAPGFLQEQI